MIHIRKSNSYFSSQYRAIPVDTGNNAVFCFHKENKMLVLANFSEQEQCYNSSHSSVRSHLHCRATEFPYMQWSSHEAARSA